jgi:hypothetical protein
MSKASSKKRIMKRLTRQELITLVDNILNPEHFTSQQSNDQLLLFCASCPDPMAAMDIVVELLEPLTATEMVDRALACPYRDPMSAPASELPLSHPFRHPPYNAVPKTCL